MYSILGKHNSIFRGSQGSPFPAILNDGNTVAWYDYKKNITEVTGVSVWGDKSGNGNDLIQADTAKQPSLNANGILFDGIDNFLKTSGAALEQPNFLYLVLKQITWTSGDRIFAGNLSSIALLYQIGTTPGIKAYAGSLSAENSDLILDTYSIVRVLFNGASSKLQVNTNTATNGDFGAQDLDEFTLARAGADATNYSNIEVKEIIIRKIADGATDEAAIYDYLSNKYSI